MNQQRTLFDGGKPCPCGGLVGEIDSDVGECQKCGLVVIRNDKGDWEDFRAYFNPKTKKPAGKPRKAPRKPRPKTKRVRNVADNYFPRRRAKAGA